MDFQTAPFKTSCRLSSYFLGCLQIGIRQTLLIVPVSKGFLLLCVQIGFRCVSSPTLAICDCLFSSINNDSQDLLRPLPANDEHYFLHERQHNLLLSVKTSSLSNKENAIREHWLRLLYLKRLKAS